MFFALAFIAALNPKLLGLDLLLIENRRPRAMFASLLAAGICTGVAIGLIDMLALHAHAVTTQGKASAGVDLGLGLLLLLIGGMVMTGLLADVWARRPQSRRRAAKKTASKDKETVDSWAVRALREPRLGVAVIIGIVVGLPGAAYLTALHDLITGTYSTATQVVAVFVFVIIEFLLIIIPWVFLELWPAGTARVLRRSLQWLTSHATALVGWVCILLGVYLTVSGLVRLG